MAAWYNPPPTITATLLATVPETLWGSGPSDWHPSTGETPSVFLEGPTSDKQGNLYFVDIPFGRVLRYSVTSKVFDEIAQYDGEPNGLALGEDGCLVIADYKQGMLLLDPSSGSVTPLLTRCNLERFKGPNDVIISKGGDIYFTDQGQTGMTDPTGRVYRLSPSGKLDCLVSNGPSPNGLVLSPDENVLYVAMTRDNSVWRCPLHSDGTTSKVTRFFSIFGTAGPDGLTVDDENNLFICVPGLGSIFVVQSSGMPIARIITPSGGHEHITNCIFGSTEEDKNRLYFLVGDKGQICYVDWHTKGGTPIRDSRAE